MDAIIVAIIGAIESIGIAIIGAMVTRANKREADYRERRERERKLAARVTKASYELQFATADALDVVLRKLHGDKINGECEEARCSLKAAKTELNDICNEQLASAARG